MPIIFLIYSMSFFMLGVTIAIEGLSSDKPGHFKHFIGSPLGSLSIFGLAYGLFEFIGIYNIFYGGLILPLRVIRLLVLPVSFYFLCKFASSWGRRPQASEGEKNSSAAAADHTGRFSAAHSARRFELANVACSSLAYSSPFSLKQRRAQQ